MYLIPSRPSFLVLTGSSRKSFLYFYFSHLRHITLPLSSAIISRQSYLPILFLLTKPLFLSSITSHQSYLSLIFFSTDPFSLLLSFSPIISCALFPGSPILSCAAIASQPSFLPLLFLLTNPFSISLPSHQSFLSVLFVFTKAAAYLTPPTCPYLAAACRRLLSPSPA